MMPIATDCARSFSLCACEYVTGAAESGTPAPPTSSAALALILALYMQAITASKPTITAPAAGPAIEPASIEGAGSAIGGSDGGGGGEGGDDGGGGGEGGDEGGGDDGGGDGGEGGEDGGGGDEGGGIGGGDDGGGDGGGGGGVGGGGGGGVGGGGGHIHAQPNIVGFEAVPSQ